MDFKGRVAMVTGASVGIGRAVALQLAAKGADLILLDIDGTGLDAISTELKAYAVKTKSFVCDVSNEHAVTQAVQQSLDYFGKIDILVNNAALWRCPDPFFNVSTAEWEKFFKVNVMGVVHCTRAVIDNMLENRYGRIINVASVAGVYGSANAVHYATTKGAVIAMTQSLAKIVADKGILVNCVSPGSVSPSENKDIDFQQSSGLNYMGRTGTDRENADLICFLASDQASYISGQNILIDGCRKIMS